MLAKTNCYKKISKEGEICFEEVGREWLLVSKVEQFYAPVIRIKVILFYESKKRRRDKKNQNCRDKRGYNSLFELEELRALKKL